MSMIWFVTLLRTIVYIWIGTEFANLAYLYNVGYAEHKPTPIIQALQVMFLILSIFFFGLAFIPIIFQLDLGIYSIYVGVLPIVIIPLGIVVRWFRLESLRRQVMKLPDKKNIIKK